jgi:arylsulfatase A-like enzyme
MRNGNERQIVNGYFRKCEPFEGSANIPLIIAGSTDLGFRAGQVCLQPVCLEDLLPTLLDLAGIPCPNVDGESLVPVLSGEDREIRSWLHFEHASCYTAFSVIPSSVAPHDHRHLKSESRRPRR